MNQHVNLTFSLKYLVNFSKSAALSDVVQLMMSNDVPLLVSLVLQIWRQFLTRYPGFVPVRTGIHPVLLGAEDWRRLEDKWWFANAIENVLVGSQLSLLFSCIIFLSWT
jgi:hypothetical protein